MSGLLILVAISWASYATVEVFEWRTAYWKAMRDSRRAMRAKDSLLSAEGQALQAAMADGIDPYLNTAVEGYLEDSAQLQVECDKWNERLRGQRKPWVWREVAKAER